MLAKFNAEKLHDVRKEKHLTQESLAEQTGTSDRYIRALECGHKKNPSAVLLCQISQALGISMDELMDIAEDDTISE